MSDISSIRIDNTIYNIKDNNAPRKDETYTTTEINTLLSAKANIVDVYSKAEVDTILTAKANTVDVYSKAEVDTILTAKANTVDVYSKAEVDTILTAKANTVDVYNKTEADTLLAAKANTTDLGDLAIENDAPSDNSEYVRKNGAWTVASGSSGVPSGGTIGQVLAKRSDTDGDVGWFSISNLPRRKWYLIDGITETDVIAAYQFVAQPNEATALLNINDGADYPLSKVLGSEKWSVNRGFFIPGSQNAGLTNGTLAGLYTNMLSAAFGFYGASTSKSCAPGIMPNRQRVLELASYTSEYTGKPAISTYSNTNAYLGSTFSSKGVLSGNWEATPKMYHDGVALSLSRSGTIFSDGRGKIFGHLNSTGTYSSCYITALVFYNITLDSSQHVELANNIYELGGLD